MKRAAPGVTGSRWEDRALDHLEAAGLRLRARNFQCRLGELDLIMDEADTLVFIEVRYRRSAGFGGGLESVTAAKRQRLVQAAGLYLAANPALAQRTCRFDVIAVSGSLEQPHFDWRRAAFDAA